MVSISNHIFTQSNLVGDSGVVLHFTQPLQKHQVIAFYMEEWSSIAPTEIQTLVESMPMCTEVVEG